MKRVFAISLLLVLSFGLLAEATEGPCEDSAQDPCCVCLCHAPLIKPAVTQITKISVPHYVVVADTREAQPLFDKSVFHPPEALS